ncbi:hypothetical protein E2C01_043662 [Portunus trituberculatus]|uniref:Uncharacterized protein n=1 Tax=Portunus trituberculatus TaxID=210409 RepID=A0A5B7FWP6_PORTR|nr:hypothetical protein [Portunus trituberculatus]
MQDTNVLIHPSQAHAVAVHLLVKDVIIHLHFLCFLCFHGIVHIFWYYIFHWYFLEKLQHDGLALFLGKFFLHHCVAEECVHGSGAPTYQPAVELSGVQFEIASGAQFENANVKKELAKTVIKRVQDSTQEFDQEVEEMIRLGRYSERGRRPMKVKMRSQVAVEEIMARKGKLANDVEHKDIWIKRDMKLEERKKEKVLRSEAKEKNKKRTEVQKKFYWRVLDMRLKKWYLRKKEEVVKEAIN